MNAQPIHRLKKLLRAELFSPTGFAVRAVLIAVAFLICHVAGLREHTTFLSGTSASANTGWDWSVVWGVTYIFAYLGFVLLAPILLLAAASLGVWQKWFVRKTEPAMEASKTHP